VSELHWGKDDPHTKLMVQNAGHGSTNTGLGTSCTGHFRGKSNGVTSYHSIASTSRVREEYKGEEKSCRYQTERI
jgi:hypothetical protein